MRQFKPLLMSLGFAFALTSCSLFNDSPDYASQSGDKLPALPISSSLAQVGQTLTYKNVKFSIRDIDTEAYPTQISYAITDGPFGKITVGDWFVFDDYLIKVSFQDKQSDVSDGFVLVTFHDLEKLTSKDSNSAEDAIFTYSKMKENEIKFFRDGFISITEVRDNNPLLREDESAEVTIYYQDKKYEGVVREFSHAFVGDDLVLQAGEIFMGSRPDSGQLNLRLEKSEVAFADAFSNEQKVFNRSDLLETGEYTVTFDTLPLAPKGNSEGILLEPDGYRVLMTFENEDGQKHEFLVLEDQSIRWGMNEFIIDKVEATSGEYRLLTYQDSKFPTQRLNPNDPLVQEEEERNQAAPRKIESVMEVGDVLNFGEAKFELTRVVENDPTNLFDDQAILNVSGPGISDYVYLRESTRQTIQGDNRWWILEADLIQKTRRGGQARIAIEAGKFLGR